ncbi:MAG: hypothetical protein A3E82_09360 [Gammaproteobacteria bacterium RIFCSPHIGHO2_12_FULL_38_11]|nr:MAG: hypothetical protein A3E82_09360 [Gammaproteobacteria bacterium RIFCSPHIGHO2_12_FULL_38_11]
MKSMINIKIIPVMCIAAGIMLMSEGAIGAIAAQSSEQSSKTGCSVCQTVNNQLDENLIKLAKGQSYVPPKGEDTTC